VGLFGERRGQTSRSADTLAENLLAQRTGVRTGKSVPVNNDTAMRNSGVWACLRLRANVLSTMPVDVMRDVAGVNTTLKTPPVLVEPGGSKVGIQEWLYSTQVDLDRAGNDVGIITKVDGNGLPARIDLQPINEVVFKIRDGEIYKFKIGKKEYDPDVIWHEKQYTISGLPFGLSPIAYAAWTLGEYQSIQEYATTWFDEGGKPSAVLKQLKQKVDKDQAQIVKDNFKQTTSNGDVFVTGMDWEYTPLQAQQATMEWLAAKGSGIVDVARFLDCPADLIDAQVSGSSVTYANVVQRNLQFLVLHLGPAVARRENALSKLLARPRFVKLNAGALLRMDPLTQAQVLGMRIKDRTLTPDEGRDLYDAPPLIESDYEQFDRLWPTSKGATPTAAVPPKATQGAV